MGTPEFAVAPLEALIQSQHQVVAVVTVPDKPAGRGRNLKASAVKESAIKHGIPVLQPEKLRDESFQKELRALNPDVFVVVAFRMLPKAVWSIPPKGTFNLHASLLPNYRGAAPIHWAVINGEHESGVTTFLIDEEIDTGNILLQSKTDIGPNETTGELYHRLMNLGAPLVVQTVDGLMNDSLQPIPQDESAAMKPAPKLFREHQYLDLSKSASELHNQIRGLTPFPSPLLRLTYNGETIEVKVAESSYENLNKGEVGELIWEENELLIQTPNGILKIGRIQWPGKRQMTVRDFKNGFADWKSIRSVGKP
ncbi:MAG: methionyl-tRNA formyltransferase [Flavobacteriia bacterium]|nr:methionyl-tRNA formyltransferase [Flavobacteriia bacterium]